MIFIHIKKNPQTASGRTRDKINKAGPEFIVEKESAPHRPNEMLLRSTKTGWFGWLPINEFIILNRTEQP